MKCKSIYCDRKPIAKGLCSKHHRRFMKGEDVNQKTWHELSAQERFMSKLKQNNKTGCWEWLGHVRGEKSYYGIFDYRNHRYSAHRFSWMLHNGCIPKGGDYRGMCICHKCDNPLCVNPDHLFLGTHTENMRDKIKKGRCGQKSKTHCKYGHRFDEVNTWLSKQGSRHCRSCHREKELNRKALKRAGG